MPVQFLVCTAD